MHRYYSVASRLTHVRVTMAKGTIEPGLPFNTIGTGTSSQSFNLAYEEERRRQMEIVWRRSKEEEVRERGEAGRSGETPGIQKLLLTLFHSIPQFVFVWLASLASPPLLH